MTETRGDTLEGVINELQGSIPEIEACAIVSVEGLPIVSALPMDVDEAKVAAMTAAMLTLGEKAAIELGKGTLEQVNVKGVDGWLLVVSAGLNACLTVSTTANAKLGLIFLDMKRAADKIATMI
ncbi:MAG: roadblock/LC7 domain-containing protein [Candidatus Thorarchaeota archaeon]|nr:roadblock/LC7 domain-containing protein [Candidatus Thorarchaeota archaeon]MCK4740097.1 roadblock/LC7 domain-containing protein [Candidatus Thorarchaeota archaeon]